MSDSIAAQFGKFVGIIAIGLPLVLYKAWFITTIWAWYTPQDWQPLTMRLAVGAILLWDFLAAKTPREGDPSYAEKVLFAILGPPIGLLVAWLMLFIVR